jgi:epoxyqueuosine reductase
MREAFAAAMKSEGQRLGFSALGVAGAEETAHLSYYRDWLGRGFHGEMGYLAREDSVARRGNLRLTLAETRSVVVVAQEYYQEDPPGVPADASRGVIARYARGEDYHTLLKGRIQRLLDWIRREALARELADEVRGFAYVDTGPILERDLAQRAGLGWFGKNTLLIHPRRGSFFFVGLLLLDLELPLSTPFQADHCGMCLACLEGCPTGALLGRDQTGAPVMDARRCISYLTIESKGPIPRELRPLIGNRIFGCDICQEVCPFTRKFSSVSSEPSYSARSELDGPPLVELADRLLSLSGEEFREVFAGTAVRRARREGLLRNVCVALGNWGSDAAVPVLGAALRDPSPLVREHAAWALESIGSPEAMGALKSGPPTR